jgi:hypothetical protein
MSHHGVLAGLVLIAASYALAAAPSASDRDENAEAKRPWGKESDGFRSRIWLEAAPKGAKDAVKVHYEIRNTSKDEQVVWHSGFWPNHRIDVKDADGELAPMTERGKFMRKTYDPKGRRRKHSPRKLAPGATDSAWEAYDVRELFPMADPGTYTIQYVYQQGPMKPVESNVLEVDVPGP